MYNINKYTIKDIIKQELELLNDENFQNYWGSEQQIKNENNIFNFTKVEMKDREKIYNELIQDYSELQYKYEGDILQDEINKIVDKIIENEN